MSSFLTSSTLIASVQRRAMIPANDVTFQSADFLALANEEMQIGLVPTVIQVHQEYYVTTTTVPLSVNVSVYEIPYRAIGGKLRNVFFKDTNGNLYQMTRVSNENQPYFQATTVSNRLLAYFVKNNGIVIVPAVGTNATGSLVFDYFLRPNELVDVTQVSTIKSIAVGANTTTFTVDQIPSAFSTTSAMDMLQTNPGHKTFTFDVFPTNVNTGALTLTFNNTDVPLGLGVGDYFALAGQCIIPQVPTELHSVLAERVAARCLEALGDQAGLQAANQKIAEMEQKTNVLIDNRVEGSPVKVVNYNGLLRHSRIGKKWF